MKKIVFIVEKTKTGYSAYAKGDKYPFGTTGATMKELKANMIEAANTWFEHKGLALVGPGDIAVKIDLSQFFEYYKAIDVTGLSDQLGMNRSLLAQYKSGVKKPSEKQTEKILSGIKALGRELSSLEFA